MTEHEKHPPCDIGAEQGVLGSILVNEPVFAEFAEWLKPKDFFRKPHQLIYQAMKDLRKEEIPIDVITVCSKLQESDNLESAGDRQYVIDLMLAIATTANSKYYATTVKDHALRRGAAKKLQEIAHLALDGVTPKDVSDEIANFKKRLDARVDIKEALEPLSPIMDRALERMKEIRESGKLPGIPTGFEQLDEMTGGFQPGEFIILCGDTSIGKTTLLQYMVTAGALEAGIPTAFFSLEMSKEDMAYKLLSAQAAVEFRRLRRGWCEPDEMEAIESAADILRKYPLWIADIERDAFTCDAMYSAIDQKVLQGFDPRYVVIDYIQLLKLPGSQTYDRNHEVGEISRSLKRYALSTGRTINALSQLSRANKARQDKRPQKQDLRDSGSLEQDANILLGLYRDDYFNPEMTTKRGSAELIVMKNRLGETSTLEIGFSPSTSQFYDYKNGPKQFIPRPREIRLENETPKEEDLFMNDTNEPREIWSKEKARAIVGPLIEKYGEADALSAIHKRIAEAETPEEIEHRIACFNVAEEVFLEMCPPKEEAPPPPPPAKASWREVMKQS